MTKSISASFRAFHKCTHGRNWGYVNEVCYNAATHERRHFPERLACEFHAFEAKGSLQGDPDWIPIEIDR